MIPRSDRKTLQLSPLRSKDRKYTTSKPVFSPLLGGIWRNLEEIPQEPTTNDYQDAYLWSGQASLQALKGTLSAIDLAKVNSSAYSSSAPTATPLAKVLRRTPVTASLRDT